MSNSIDRLPRRVSLLSGHTEDLQSIMTNGIDSPLKKVPRDLNFIGTSSQIASPYNKRSSPQKRIIYKDRSGMTVERSNEIRGHSVVENSPR